MTNLQALKAEIEPYSASDEASVKRLIDAGLSADAEYSADNKLTLAKCAIAMLVSFLPLTNESLGPTSQSYDRKGLEERIGAICMENGLEDVYTEQPTVLVYHGLY